MSLLKEYISLLYEEYMTKNGQEIKFEFYERSPVDKLGEDQGFVTHQLDAFINVHYLLSKSVGYIKISYIPLEKFKELYPTVWHWLKIMRGYRIDLNDLSIDSLYDYFNSGWGTNVSIERKKEFVLEKQRDAEEQFKEFKRFFVNKPYVSFINVDQSYQRLGIGQALYKKAAQIMKERGMKLHASDTQSFSAKKSWKDMDQKGITGHKSGRKFLK